MSQAIASLIVGIYLLVAEFGAPNVYNYWAILGLDIFLVIFWLCSFALLASEVAYIFAYGYSYRYSTSYAYDAILAWASCLAAAAGLGGVQL
jgi:hypothetical protein